MYRLLTPLYVFAGLALSGCGGETVNQSGSDPSSIESGAAGTDQSADLETETDLMSPTDSTSAQSTTLDAASEDFVRNAGSSNQLEIQSSELALERSQSAEVTGFATQMIADHQATAQRMASVMTTAGLSAPGAPTLTDAHAQMLRTLEESPEADFDTAYLELQMNAHQEAVALFEGYSENGTHEGLRGFAEQTLPALQGHLEMVPETPENE